MIAATACSGIGAPEVAMPHWQWAFASEIEAAPRAIMPRCGTSSLGGL
nr:hypothetical protein [Sphingobium sp.]